MFVTAGGRRLYFDLAGPETAPTVALAHSLAADGGMWAEQLPVLLAGGYRVLRLDMRGHGGSDPVAGDYTMAALADDVATVVGALGVGPVHFIGLSIGGMLGQKLAAKTPEVLTALILCDTAAHMNPAVWDERIALIRKDGMEAVAEGTMQRWFTKPFHQSNPEALKGIRNMLVRTPAEGYIGCARAIQKMDLRADDAKIICPTLIVVGEEDPATPVAEARELNAAIKGSKLVVVPQAAHITPIEQPAALTRIIGDFLATL